MSSGERKSKNKKENRMESRTKEGESPVKRYDKQRVKPNKRRKEDNER